MAERTYRDFQLADLHCYGCAHSAAHEPFPGRPSGERPCCFCVRNPDREEWAARAKEEADKGAWGWDSEFNPYTGHWYDGTEAIRVPQDNYQTLDMKDQWRVWKSADQSDLIRIRQCGAVMMLGAVMVACAKDAGHAGPHSWDEPLVGTGG